MEQLRGGTIIARTESGSAYVLTLGDGGAHWVRIAAVGQMTAGWIPSVPRVVPGERLFLGVLRTTPIREVAFLPGSGLAPTTDQQEWVAYH
jgi:hypothetical protein